LSLRRSSAAWTAWPVRSSARSSSQRPRCSSSIMSMRSSRTSYRFSCCWRCSWCGHGASSPRAKNSTPYELSTRERLLPHPLLGVIFGLPSLRLRGLYLAVSTLALHFIVIYAGSEYETRRGYSTGVVIDSPIIDTRAWYFVLLGAAAATVVLSLNLLRSRTG